MKTEAEPEPKCDIGDNRYVLRKNLKFSPLINCLCMYILTQN
jgi:hypothetical protein